MTKIKIIYGSANSKLAREIATKLRCNKVETSIDKFPDGETTIQIKEDLHSKEVILVESMAGDVNNVLIETLLLADAASRAGAKRICLVSPYLAYMRQDRKDKPGVPISAKVVANILSNSAIEHIIALDLHAKQNQGFFDVPIDEIFAADVFLPYICKKFKPRKIVFIAPDAGSIKNVRRYAELYGAPYAFVEKDRISHSRVEARNLYGDVKDKQAIIIDDICSSGSTLIQAADLLKARGATSVTAFVTHGLFTNGAVQAIDRSNNLDKLYCSDSIDSSKLILNSNKIESISVADHLAKNIKELFLEGQLTSPFA